MNKIVQFPTPKTMDLDVAIRVLSFKVKMNNYYLQDTKRFNFEERYDMYKENQALTRVLLELKEKENV